MRRPEVPPGEGHTLPHPAPPINPAVDPFVGNATIDDNLAESVQVALWNVLGHTGQHVDAKISNGVVTLSGEVADLATRTACEHAAAVVARVRQVNSHILLRDAGATPATVSPAIWTAEAEPLAQITRYCGTSEASLSAAIREAVDALDAALAARGIAPPHSLVVAYRNRHGETITVGVGMPVGAGVDVGPELAATSPAGPMVSIDVGPGAEGLTAGVDELTARVLRAGYEPGPTFWQRFTDSSFRPWGGHPASRLSVGISPRS